MHPIIAKMGPFCVYSYGLMVALGFAIAILLSYREAPKFGINREKTVDFGICILVGGLLGARIFFILSNLDYYIANPFEMLNLTKGGLVWYGGFIMGVLVGVIFVKINKINFWDGADLLAPFIPLAQAIGRIGCFLNGCCYGIPSQDGYPFGVLFPGEKVWRHPAQLYESITLLILFLILKRWQASRHFKGEIFLGYALLYSLARFSLEFVRGDNPKIMFGLTISQLLSAAIFVICLIILPVRYVIWKRNSSRSA